MKLEILLKRKDLLQSKTSSLLLVSFFTGSIQSTKMEYIFRISCQLAELHWNRRDGNKAIELYQEALSLNNSDVKVGNIGTLM